MCEHFRAEALPSRAGLSQPFLAKEGTSQNCTSFLSSIGRTLDTLTSKYIFLIPGKKIYPAGTGLVLANPPQKTSYALHKDASPQRQQGHKRSIWPAFVRLQALSG